MARPKKTSYFIDAGDFDILLEMAKKWAMYSCYSEKSMQVDRLIRCEKKIEKQKVINEILQKKVPNENIKPSY